MSRRARRRTCAAATATAVLTLVLAGCGDDPAPTSSATSSPSASDLPTTPSATPTPTPSATTATASATRTTTKKPQPTHRPTATSAPPAATRLPAVPRAGAEPTVRFPKNAPAVGSGANAVVAQVPDSVWGRMVGYSWTPGCPVGRSSLRYVTVNFWGFDGVRSRGAVVVNSSIASAAARAFTSLYEQHFRIRQMRVMDSAWGKNPKGPGADDYAAMDADNTSSFNCRYVGGQEASKTWSNHAYGKAIDVNDFENPYVDDNGTVYPSTYFLHRRSSSTPGVFSSSGSAAVRAFTSQGFSWGGLWSHPDLQHFDG